MSDTTPNLRLPYIQAAQAQKHVTHNEAIRALDALVQISVASRTRAMPPAMPTDGARFIVPPSASGAWTGFAPHIAAFQDGAWVKYVAREGWLVWVEDEDRLYAFDGTSWSMASGQSLNPTPLIGINTTADTTNRLAVAAPASLFSHAGSDHRNVINKATAADTASLLYQTAFSGRAEMGLAGDDDFHVKVSPDGTAWKEALVIDRATGAVSFPFTPRESALSNPWRGRRWTALGTSITQGGLYTGPLAALLGATLTNLGYSGGRISAPSTGGGLEIYARVASVPVDAELITLEAGINDFRTHVPLGAPADMTTATFHGALFRAGADILAVNPRRVLAYLTPYATSEDGTPDWDTPNANGNTLVQFQQAVRDIAHRLGCPVIDVGAESGISAQTASAFLSDGLHPNVAGGKRMADFIYDRLLLVRPPVATAPTTPTVATPVFSPGSGTYGAAQSVTITCATPDASIRYTTDGSPPGAPSLLYASPISVTATTTLKAIAARAGFVDSAVATATITISSGGGSLPFSPARLSPSLWFDASDLTTLFQDVAGASPVTSDSQAIALIRDKSGNGHDLTQAVAAACPVFRMAGDLRWFEFDGTRKAKLAARFTTNPSDFAIAWASRKTDTSPVDGNKSVIAGVDGNMTWMGDNVLGTTSPSVEYTMASGTTNQVYGGFDAASVHADHVSIINVAAGALHTYQNGIAGNTTSGVASVSLDGFTFAVNTYLYSGRIYQFLVFPRALTAGEITELTSWMKARAGL